METVKNLVKLLLDISQKWSHVPCILTVGDFVVCFVVPQTPTIGKTELTRL